MKESKRLIYLGEKNNQNLNQLWENCFVGAKNQEHMNAHNPYPVPNQQALDQFLMRESTYRTWLVKRKKEEDIIGFLIHGDFIPHLPNSIGFNVGRKYTKNGYATEMLETLLRDLEDKNLQETYGYCFSSNTPSIKTMMKCGFKNMGATGNYHNGNQEIKFKRVI